MVDGLCKSDWAERSELPDYRVRGGFVFKVRPPVLMLKQDDLMHNRLAVRQHEHVALFGTPPAPDIKSNITMQNLPINSLHLPVSVWRCCGKEITRGILAS
jgi:hypothetical protein